MTRHRRSPGGEHETSPGLFPAMITVATPVTDTSLAAALAAVPSSGCVVVIPAGTWNLTKPITLASNGTTLQGECGPHPAVGMAATQLNFPSGVVAITVTGAYCALDGILAKSSKSGTAAAFVVQGTRCQLTNCGAYEFGGPGCTIDSTTGANCNLFSLSGCSFLSNGGDGLYIAGPNSNAGNIIASSAAGNGGWGFHEDHTLGNTYTGCHADANGLGPYLLFGASMFSLLLGCYSEGDQPGSWIGQKCISLGGDHGAGWLPGTLQGYGPGVVLSSNGYGISATLQDALRINGLAPPATGAPGAFVPIAVWGPVTFGWRQMATSGILWIQEVVPTLSLAPP